MSNQYNWGLPAYEILAQCTHMLLDVAFAEPNSEHWEERITFTGTKEEIAAASELEDKLINQ